MSPIALARRAALALITCLCLAAIVRAQQADHVPGELLVKFQQGTLEITAVRTVRAAGGAIVRTQPVLQFSKVVLDDPAGIDAALASLRAHPLVEWIEPNGYAYALPCVRCPQDAYLVDLPDGAPENQWGIFKTGVPSLWKHGGGGSIDVGIAIVDTGIDSFAGPHADLASNIGLGHDFVDDDADPTDAGNADLYGHGTHVAGIAAAVSDGAGIAGVAYCSTLLIARVLDCTAGNGCPGTFEDIADGIQWAADNGGTVINLSLGSTVPSNAMRTAVQYAIGQGSIVVVASGNDHASTLRYPARYPETIAVGATDSGDNVANFSNYGPELDVVAPGVGIWSTFPSPPYRSWDGTSMATPFVSGIAALVRARNPGIRQAEMETYLRDHAIAVGDGTRDGHGRVDLPILQDWSDAPAAYPATSHGLSFWERLGEDASAERGIADPKDGDFRPNLGAGHDSDGHDEGAFRASFGYLPYLPPHIQGGMPSILDVNMSVCRFDGPRYGAAPARSLHLDVWADWDSDGIWETGAAAERAVADHTENPATWGGDGTLRAIGFSPVDEHIYGNPVVFRSRLAYGASVGDPTTAAKFGEVEDHLFINYVEDFDVSQRVHNGGVYASMGGWGLISDPMPDQACAHHGDWEFAIAQHPSGPPCNDAWETTSVLRTPPMDWTEYTEARIRFWYCHRIFNQCSTIPDNCRVRIMTESGSETLGPIPFGSGEVEFNVSHQVGHTTVWFEFIEETDWPGVVVIDDIRIWAYDGEDPIAVTDLALSRGPGSRTVDLSWTNKRENLYIVSPPAEPLANIHDIRYSKGPITNAAEFRNATPFTPAELVAGSPIPGMPGTPGSASFRVPSAFQTYHVALRTHDEVTNISSVSNSPGDPGDSVNVALGVTVASLFDTTAAPSDTATLRFEITNTGNVADYYALSSVDTEGWTLFPNPSGILLGAGTSDQFDLSVVVPGGATAGEVDTVRVTATSLFDPSVSDSDAGRVEVQGTVSVPSPGELPAAAAFAVRGPNPFRGTLRMELALPTAENVAVRLYDPSGRLVRSVVDGRLEAGLHALAWDGLDSRRRAAASGAYMIEARAGRAYWSRSVLKVK